MVRTILGWNIPLDGKTTPDQVMRSDDAIHVKIADRLWRGVNDALSGLSDDQGRQIIGPSVIVEVKADHLVAHLQGDLADMYDAMLARENLPSATFRANLVEAVNLACRAWAKKEHGAAFRATPTNVRREE